MRAGAGESGDGMKRFLINLLKAIVAVAIYAVLLWKGIGIAQSNDWLTVSVIVLTVLGVTYSASAAVFRIVGEVSGGIMVIAEFLNRHLLEPQKQRLLEQGRKQERDKIRARLERRGLDADEILSSENEQGEP